MKKTIAFTLCQVADVSTGYLEQTDLKLLLKEDCPTRFAAVDGGFGTFHNVCLEGPDDWTDSLRQMADYGLSPRFIEIMAAARDQRIPYVRFDADGGDIEEDEEEEEPGNCVVAGCFQEPAAGYQQCLIHMETNCAHGRLYTTACEECDEDCDCDDRSWRGELHDSACPLAGRPRA